MGVSVSLSAQAAWITVIALRLSGAVHWSWWWVLAPAWLFFVPFRINLPEMLVWRSRVRWTKTGKWGTTTFSWPPEPPTFFGLTGAVAGATWTTLVVLDLTGHPGVPLWLVLLPAWFAIPAALVLALVFAISALGGLASLATWWSRRRRDRRVA